MNLKIAATSTLSKTIGFILFAADGVVVVIIVVLAPGATVELDAIVVGLIVVVVCPCWCNVLHSTLCVNSGIFSLTSVSTSS